MNLLFFSGSSQVGSVNWRLAEAVAQLAQKNFGDRASVISTDLERFDLPRHGGTAAGEPDAHAGVTAFREIIRDADGIFITSDEYTGSYSAILKNALAWLKSEDDENEAVLDGMPVALCGASIGGVRALRGQPALHQMLHELGASVISQNLSLGLESSPFGKDGRLTADIEQQILRGCLSTLLNKVFLKGRQKEGVLDQIQVDGQHQQRLQQ